MKPKPNQQPSVYSKATLDRLKKLAMKIPGVTGVCHIFPRAYCVAKPAPCCAVFATPWMDAEKQIRTPSYSSSEIINTDVWTVKAGDWCAIAYVVKPGVGENRVLEILGV